MALANVAWALASNGKRVAAVDFDLEAPGLPRFFAPFLDAGTLASVPGVIDLFTDFTEGSISSQIPSIEAGFRDPLNLDQYTIRLRWEFPAGGALDLIPAGRPGASYARNVTRFDWNEFYARFGGFDFVESLKRMLKENYDYVLIDSRTGINETSGICTVQMPDILVVLFTLNRQAIDGVARVAESVETQQANVARDPKLRVFPITTRVELAEKEKLDRARDRVKMTFSRFLWHLPSATHAQYWSDVEMLYYPYYAYEETLCAFVDRPGSRSSMLASIERISAYLTDGSVEQIAEIDDAKRLPVLEAFEQGSFRAMEETARSPIERTCFISYSSRDDDFAKKLDGDLRQRGVKCWFAPRDLPIGAKTRHGIDEAIRTHDRMIIILSEHSIRSSWVEKEVETAFEREAATGQTILMPIRLDSSVMETNEAWASDIRRQRNIGNFSEWQDYDLYATSLAALLKSPEQY
jgi:hypothetical protein